MYTSLYRLGQVCNHIAALLFYIEHHASISLTSCNESPIEGENS